MHAQHPSLIAPVQLKFTVKLYICSKLFRPQMSGEHCIVGTFADNLMCIPVENVILNEGDAGLAVKSTITFLKNDEYMQGRVLFMGGKFLALSESPFHRHVMFWFIYCNRLSVAKPACTREIGSILSGMPKRKFQLSTWLAMRAISSLRKTVPPSSSRASMLVDMTKKRQLQTTTVSSSLSPVPPTALLSGM